jgi:hypothetical protein
MSARRLFGIAVFLTIACSDSVPVRLEIKETDGELLMDTVYAVSAFGLPQQPCIPGPFTPPDRDCFAPDEYGILVNGRITGRTCNTLVAHATDERAAGTHQVTLNVETVMSAFEECSTAVSFVYDAAIAVRGNRFPTAVDSWILEVYHDGVAVPPYN